jgi:hypothetical protein
MRLGCDECPELLDVIASTHCQMPCSRDELQRRVYLGGESYCLIWPHEVQQPIEREQGTLECLELHLPLGEPSQHELIACRVLVQDLPQHLNSHFGRYSLT